MDNEIDLQGGLEGVLLESAALGGGSDLVVRGTVLGLGL